MKIITLFSLFFVLQFVSLSNQETFLIEIVRKKVKGDLIYGEIYVNSKHLGQSFENRNYKVAAGTYKGIMRYNSGKNFVQSTLGKLSRKGDFLLEVSGIKGRRDILFHQGNKPEHSTGCILLGPANKSPEGNVFIGEDHPLRKLRVLFYGTDEPNSCPDKNIEIKIIEDGGGGRVTIHYGFSNPNGVTFKHKGTSYTFSAGQKQSFNINNTSGETIEIWECPTNQTCRWSSFTIYPGNEYVITDSGNGRGLTLKKR